MNRRAKLRSAAYLKQSGLCFYCRQPMWLAEPEEFARTHQLSIRQARAFRCTAEHLSPRSRGGATSRSNVAAACLCCNQRRGASEDLSAFLGRVQRRCRAGKWHSKFPARVSENALELVPFLGTA